jgi:pSer/pThr/pTyr-binding forkhead associated (FHA) protein
MAVISLMYQDKRLDSIPIGMGDTFMIGRQEGNDIVIDNLAVSFHHAKIEAVGDEFLLIDLKSENGTFVNAQRIKAHWLADGDVVTIGKHTLAFADPSVRKPAGATPSSIIETMQMDTEQFRDLLRRNGSAEAAVAAPSARPTLSFLSGHRRELPLGGKSVRIGRSKSADIVADGLFVGETAAVINRMEDGWYLSRVGGLARVKVNREVVREPVKLKRLDVIAVGRLKLQFLMRG